MAIAELPSIARVSELRLAISPEPDQAFRPLNRKTQASMPYRETWSAEIVFAALREVDAHTLAAFFEALDGQVLPFKLPLTAGKFSQVAAFDATLAAVPALGADVVRLNLDPATGKLKRGTLFTVGDIETTTFQLFECVETVDAAADTSVKVAPRVRWTFESDASVTVGSVDAKLALSKDEFVVPITLSSGIVSVECREAIA